jgi:predicted  nucleic acid-binding Zn-ribbon protein
VKNQLEAVVELQQAMDELRDVEGILDGVPDWMQELHDEHSANADEIEQLEAILEEASQDHRSAETSIQDAESRYQKFQEQITQVRTQREYAALLKEIDTIKAEIQALEEKGLTAMERHEEVARDLEERRQAYSGTEEKYQEALSRWEEEKPTVAQRAESLRSEVARLERELNPRIGALFHRLLDTRKGEALAPIKKVTKVGGGNPIWHCSACHYQIRPQAAVEIRTGRGVVQCDGCRRILFAAAEDSDS